MDGFKKIVTEWRKVTEARVIELRELASSLHSNWEEVKGSMNQGIEQRRLIEQTDVEVLGTLSVIEKDLGTVAGSIKNWCGISKDETIGLDELVEDALREKKVVCKGRTEQAMQRKLLEGEKDRDHVRDVGAMKFVEGLGALLDLTGDDSVGQSSQISRVEKSLAEYLKVDERYCSGEVDNDKAKAHVETFTLGRISEKLNNAILKYVFDEERHPWETVIATDTISLTREEILPLFFKRLATKKVVDVFVEMLTVEERKERGNRARFWWIPTYITRPLEDENYVLNKRNTWSKWMGNLDEVCKIYVPVKLNGTWFLAIIRIEDSIVEVACRDKDLVLKECLAVVHDVLEALDEVLMDDIVECKPIGWRFIDFEVYQGHIPIEVDSSGMFVMKMMHAAIDEGGLCNQGDVEEEVNALALKILKAEVNKAWFDLGSKVISVSSGLFEDM